jgi:acetoin utilization protein AcuB
MKKAIFIKDIMRPPLPVAHLDMALSQIIETLEKNDLDEIIVVEKGNLRGVINRDDALKSLSPFIGTMAERKIDRSSLIKRAHQVMHHTYHKVSEMDKIEDVAKVVLEKKLKCVPIVNEYGNLSGFITYKDLYTHFFKFYLANKPENDE